MPSCECQPDVSPTTRPQIQEGRKRSGLCKDQSDVGLFSSWVPALGTCPAGLQRVGLSQEGGGPVPRGSTKSSFCCPNRKVQGPREIDSRCEEHLTLSPHWFSSQLHTDHNRPHHTTHAIIESRYRKSNPALASCSSYLGRRRDNLFTFFFRPAPAVTSRRDVRILANVAPLQFAVPSRSD